MRRLILIAALLLLLTGCNVGKNNYIDCKWCPYLGGQQQMKMVGCLFDVGEELCKEINASYTGNLPGERDEFLPYGVECLKINRTRRDSIVINFMEEDYTKCENEYLVSEGK